MVQQDVILECDISHATFAAHDLEIDHFQISAVMAASVFNSFLPLGWYLEPSAYFLPCRWCLVKRTGSQLVLERSLIIFQSQNEKVRAAKKHGFWDFMLWSWSTKEEAKQDEKKSEKETKPFWQDLPGFFLTLVPSVDGSTPLRKDTSGRSNWRKFLFVVGLVTVILRSTFGEERCTGAWRARMSLCVIWGTLASFDLEGKGLWKVMGSHSPAHESWKAPDSRNLEMPEHPQMPEHPHNCWVNYLPVIYRVYHM